VFYWVVKAILGPILAVLWQPRAYGVENVPRTGPAIMVSNHLSFSDHFFGPLPLPRKMVSLAKSDYFTGTGVKGLVSRLFFSGVGSVPIDRSGRTREGQRDDRSFRHQGTRNVTECPVPVRSADGRLHPALRLETRHQPGPQQHSGRVQRHRSMLGPN
jgi:1-acyl-sn-glycerol-3-phosphate acyltransferase